MKMRVSQMRFLFVLPIFIGGVFSILPAEALSQYAYPYQYSYGYPMVASAASVGCAFERNLGIGSSGEDARCLQEYLNASGFEVASFGAGSPGNETTYFGSRTAGAVSRWQAAYGMGSSGSWDALSRAKYNSMKTESGGRVLGAYSDAYGYQYSYQTPPYYQPPVYPFPNYYYQVSGTALRVARAATAFSQFVGAGILNQAIGGFQFSNTGESVVIQRMTYDIEISRASGSSASVDDIRLVYFVDQYGSLIAGPFDAAGSGTNGTITFTSAVTIQRGERDYFLKAQLGSDFREGDRITVSLEPGYDLSSIRGEISGAYITATPSGTVSSYSATIRGTDVNISLGSIPVSQTIVSGAQDVLFATYVFDTTASSEDMRLAAMPIRYSASAYPDRLTGCQLFDGGFALNTGGNVVNPPSYSGTGGDLLFYLDSGFVISRNSIKTISLRCDVSGSAVSGTAYRFGLQTAPTVIGVQSGRTFSADISADSGPTMTVSGGGAFSVTLSPASPSYRIAAAGATEVAGVYALRATSEAIRLSQIRLELSGSSIESSSADVSEITLWDGGSMVGRGVFIGTARYMTIPLTGEFIIPKDAEKSLTVRVLLADVGISQPGTEGALIRINFDGDSPGDTKGVGLSSGTQVISGTGTDTNVAGVRLFNTVPTFAKLPIDTATLINGEQKLMRWSVAANFAADLGIYKFTLRFAPSLVSLSNVNIHAYADSGFSVPLFIASGDGRLDDTGKSLSSDGTVDIVAENASGSPNPIQVPAGLIRYFELRGTISGAVSGSALVATLEGDSAYPSVGTLMGTAAQIDGDAEDDFIWSPNARGTSGISESDWTNGYFVSGLPGAGITQVLAR